MIAGVLLRALGWPLKLVFTSAAQRHHTWLTRWLIRRMDAIIATSELSASFLKREATVVMHGVDTDAYAPPADRAAAFARSGIAGPLCDRLLRPGARAKGQRRLRRGDVPAVAALSGFHRRHRRRRRAGAAGLCERLDESGSRPPVCRSRIVITGELAIEEVQRWYRRLTIYAFTSRNEGFGLTLIEAMSAGAALVASRAGAAEFVVEDGVTGVLTPPGDVDALVAALEPLMRDPAAAIDDGRAGRGRGCWRNSASMPKPNAIAEVYRTLV